MSIETHPIAEGNTQIVALFEHYLAKAKEGKAGYGYAALCYNNADAHVNAAGVMELEPTAAALAENLTMHIKKSMLNRIPPHVQRYIPADRVFYNVAGGPLSFDFIPWLIDQEQTRIREKAPFPLKVRFWFGADGKSGLDAPVRVLFFENVVKPALKLIGAVEDPTMEFGRFKEFYANRYITEACKAGESIPYLEASEEIIEQVRLHCKFYDYGYKAPVVITLRETTPWPQRNSNFTAWTQFAWKIREEGERVIFVRDYSKADQTHSYFDTYPEASKNILVRMALYQLAKYNLTVSAGASALTLYSDTPWMTFIELKEDGYAFRPDTPSFWKENQGIEQGEQYPWCKENQRLIWKPDTYENIVEAWEQRK